MWGGIRSGFFELEIDSTQTGLTFAIAGVEFNGPALDDMQIGEANGKREKHKEQEELELLADFLQREAHPPQRSMARSVENSAGDWRMLFTALGLEVIEEKRM